MKQYSVSRDTNSRLLTVDDKGKSWFEQTWKTRKDLVFNEKQMLISPARYHRKPSMYTNTQLVSLALKGYAVFCCDSINDDYLIAVPIDTMVSTVV